MNSKHRFSINFDLHTDRDSEKELREKINISLSRMYEIIENHLLANGFEWVQGSGYITKEPISSKNLTLIIRDLFANNIWLGHFTRDIKRTIVDENTYSYSTLAKQFDEEYKNKYYKKKSKKQENTNNNSYKPKI